MKFKYCVTLTVILIVLFSLATVAASDNVTDEESLASDVSVVEDLKDYKNQNILKGDSSSDEEVDLSVVISVENIYHDEKFNRAGYLVPWTITAKVSGATAHDVKIYEIMSGNMEYVKHNLTRGEFNPTTGIWDIGDLSSSDSVSLLIWTKLKEDGRFNLTVDGETTSNDMDLSNNHAFLKIKSGTGKKPSNTTKTSDQSGGLDGDDRPGSDSYNSFVVKEDDPPYSPGGGDDPSPSPQNPDKPSDEGGGGQETNHPSGGDENQGSDSGEGGSSDSNGQNQQSESNSDSVAKSTSPILQAVSETLESLNNLFNFNDDSNDDRSPSVVKAIAAQDYTKLPFLIFAAFLILLMSFVGYDKIKS